jgi:phosphatidylglycerol:prolipoprotein diacylglycerol transferase
MALCGIFSAGIYACAIAKKRKNDYVEIVYFILFIFIGVFAGSHILYALVNYKEVIYVFKNIEKINTFENFQYALTITIGGSIFYGGLIGGLITGYIVIKKNKKYAEYIDIVAVNIPLFHCFARIGCFLGGCCFGVHSETGFTFTNCPIEEANGVSRFPVQLLEASFNLGLFFVLNHLLKKDKLKDRLIYAYLVIYAVGRFFIEYLRGDAYRGMWWFLSTSQMISILILLFVLITFILRKKTSAAV